MRDNYDSFRYAPGPKPAMDSFRYARQRQQRMRKIARMKASYKFKLNAMLMVDQRKGQVWG